MPILMLMLMLTLVIRIPIPRLLTLMPGYPNTDHQQPILILAQLRMHTHTHMHTHAHMHTHTQTYTYPSYSRPNAIAGSARDRQRDSGGNHLSDTTCPNTCVPQTWRVIQQIQLAVLGKRCRRKQMRPYWTSSVRQVVPLENVYDTCVSLSFSLSLYIYTHVCVYIYTYKCVYIYI